MIKKLLSFFTPSAHSFSMEDWKDAANLRKNTPPENLKFIIRNDRYIHDFLLTIYDNKITAVENAIELNNLILEYYKVAGIDAEELMKQQNPKIGNVEILVDVLKLSFTGVGSGIGMGLTTAKAFEGIARMPDESNLDKALKEENQKAALVFKKQEEQKNLLKQALNLLPQG